MSAIAQITAKSDIYSLFSLYKTYTILPLQSFFLCQNTFNCILIPYYESFFIKIIQILCCNLIFFHCVY